MGSLPIENCPFRDKSVSPFHCFLSTGRGWGCSPRINFWAWNNSWYRSRVFHVVLFPNLFWPECKVAPSILAVQKCMVPSCVSNYQCMVSNYWIQSYMGMMWFHNSTLWVCGSTCPFGSVSKMMQMYGRSNHWFGWFKKWYISKVVWCYGREVAWIGFDGC